MCVQERAGGVGVGVGPAEEGWGRGEDGEGVGVLTIVRGWVVVVGGGHKV